MRIVVKKTEYLQGDVTLPGSKSQAIRAMMFGLLAHGRTSLYQLPPGEDIEDALAVIQALGASIKQNGSMLMLHSEGFPFRPNTDHIDTGNSGITTRFILPLLGLRQHGDQPMTLTCGEQMRARPMASLFQALRNLGMHIECLQEADSLPANVTGCLLGGKTQVSGITSQYLSALLIALPLAQNDSEICVENLHERPYVEMTLAWLKEQKIQIRHVQENNRDIFFISGQQQYQSFEYTVPGDFSSASYFIAAGVMFPGEIILKNLDVNNAQGDKQLISIVQSMGADIEATPSQICIRGGKPLRGVQINANAIPDLLPTLAVLGTLAQGRTEILNVPQARLKETDRIGAMAQTLQSMGARISEQADGLIIEQSTLKGAQVSSYGDHRTAMALSLAGLCAQGETEICGGQAINKTYPNFIEDMKKIGGNIEVHHE